MNINVDFYYNYFKNLIQCDLLLINSKKNTYTQYEF